MAFRWPNLSRDRSGNVVTLFALISPVLITIMALAIDVAVVGHKKRELQNASDLAAILAAQNLDDYYDTALANLAANGFPIQSVETGNTPNEDTQDEILTTQAVVEIGRYQPNPRIAPERRFVPNATPVNSVRVTATHKAELFFGASLAAPPDLTARSVAYSVSEAAFTVGTRLVHFNDGIANALLNGMLGTDVELSVMDYEDLLDADVSLLSTLDALSTEAHLNAVTYEDILTSRISLAQLAASLADQIPVGNHAADALTTIALDPVAQATELQLDELLDLGTLSDSHLGSINGPYAIKVRALDMLAAGAGLATGEHQIELDLAGDVPGLADVRVTLLIGERPQASHWLTLTNDLRADVQTAQTRLLIEIAIGSGGGLLSDKMIYLPLYVELASAKANLASIECPAGREENAEVTLNVVPSVAHVWIGSPPPVNLTTFSADFPVQRAQLIDTPLLDVFARAQLDIGGHRGERVTFTAAEIRDGTTKTVETRRMVDSILMSLLGRLDLRVDAIGLSVTTPSHIRSALTTTLAPLASPLDELLDTVLSVAGISVGEADVRVSGVYCQRAVLVQ